MSTEKKKKTNLLKIFLLKIVQLLLVVFALIRLFFSVVMLFLSAVIKGLDKFERRL